MRDGQNLCFFNSKNGRYRFWWISSWVHAMSPRFWRHGVALSRARAVTKDLGAHGMDGGRNLNMSERLHGSIFVRQLDVAEREREHPERIGETRPPTSEQPGPLSQFTNSSSRIQELTLAREIPAPGRRPGDSGNDRAQSRMGW